MRVGWVVTEVRVVAWAENTTPRRGVAVGIGVGAVAEAKVD